METIHRFSLRLFPISLAERCLIPSSSKPISQKFFHNGSFSMNKVPKFIPNQKRYSSNSSSSTSIPKAGWFLGLGEQKKITLPTIVKAGDPVLHEPAREVDPKVIGSEKIQKIIDDMVLVMRNAPGVGLAAPQLGIPLRIIVLEDTKEYISYANKEETEAQDRRPFDLLFH